MKSFLNRLSCKLGLLIFLSYLPLLAWAQPTIAGAVLGTGQPPFRTGDHVRIYGSNLSAFPCTNDSLILRWNGATPGFVRLRSSGNATFSQTQYALTIGAADTIHFLMPASVPCGMVRASVRKHTAASCASPQTSAERTIGRAGNKATIAYPRSVYCLSDTNTYPTRSEAGTFTSATIPVTFLSTTTGRITLHSGLIGTHVIKFDANQDVNIDSLGCRDTMNVTITVNANGTPQNLSYPPGQFCPAQPGVVVLDTLPGVSGTYSAVPAGLDVDSTTGVIRVDSSATGTYLVTFTPEHDACSSPVYEAVEIDSIRSVDFFYQNGICAGDSGLIPVISQYYPGQFSVNALFGATGVLVIDPMTGALDASGSSGGTYEVVYAPNATLNCRDNSRYNVYVVPSPNSQFTIAQDSACNTGDTIALTLASPSTVGTFYDRSGVVSFLTGPDRVVAGASLGGPLAITFVASRTDSGVTCLDSTSQPFTVIAPQAATIQYPITSLCSGGFDTLSPVFVSGTLGGRFLWMTPSASNPVVDPVTGQVFITPATPNGSYTLKYRFAGYNVCKDSIILPPIVLAERPRMEFYFPASNDSAYYEVCVTDPVDVLVASAPSIGYTPVGISRAYTLYGSLAGVPSYPVPPSLLLDPTVLGVGGPYPIVLSTSQASCTAFDTIFLKVKEFYSSAFDYLDEYACQGGSNPVPHIQGTGGGVFTQITQINITPDPVTGEIDISVLDTINGSQFIIQYSTLNLDPVCSDSTRDTIEVIGNNSADFTYNGVNFCKSDAQILIPLVPNTTTPVQPDSFSVTLGVPHPDSLVIDTLGVVDVAASAPGTYTIQHTVGFGTTCVSQFSLSITILEGFVPTTMNYPNNTYCAGQTNPTPIVTGEQGGVFIGTQGVNLLNAQGQIDLTNSLPNDSVPYVIEYRLENQDGCVLSLYDTLLIQSLGGSYFLYDPAFICSTVDTVRLDSSPVNTTGTFSLRNASFNLVPSAINPLTGEIYPDALDSTNFQRLVTVYYTPDTNACAQPHQQPLTFLRGPENASIRVSPDSVSCAGEDVTIEGLGTLDGAWFYVNGGPPPFGVYDQLESFIRSSQYEDSTLIEVVLFTGVLDTLDDGNGNYLLTPELGYIIDESKICFVKESVTLEIKPLPFLTLVDSTEVLTSDQPAIFGLMSSMDLTTVDWFARNDTSPGNATFDPAFEDGVPFNVANTVYPITNNVILTAENSPAQAEYVFTPMADGCQGPSLVYHLNINPNGTDVFVPQVFTPDFDDLNETWYIQVRSGIREEDYTIDLYNRAGGLVYRMDPLTPYWNGGDLPDGVYWWNLRDRQGNSVNKGGLTIRRK